METMENQSRTSLPNRATRVLIADDHDVVRSGIRAILEAQPNCEVIAEASDGKQAIVKAIETKPDVVVVDYSMPLVNGIEVTRQIRAQLPGTEVVVFSMHDDESLIHDAFEAGAKGYVVKTDAKQDLIAAIQAFPSRRSFYASKTAKGSLSSCVKRPARRSSSLTNREREILQLIAEGYTSKQIARNLNIQLKTVETHRASLKRKLQASTPAALVRYAIRHKLVEL
jgi:DNA-binding NarL/FixJ family response regulator